MLRKKKSTLSVLGINKVKFSPSPLFSLYLALAKSFMLFLKAVASNFPNFEEECEF